MNYYEKLFADAIVDDQLNEDRLLDCFKVLARRVVDKTRPYSRKDTEDYYRTKIDEAWAQIQAVDTPELKLEKYDTNMIWLMADEQFTKKTTDYVANAPGSEHSACRHITGGTRIISGCPVIMVLAMAACRRSHRASLRRPARRSRRRRRTRPRRAWSPSQSPSPTRWRPRPQGSSEA